MSVRSQHLVVLSGKDGSINLHPLRSWMRKNTEFLPDGKTVSDYNSYQLHGLLKAKGWSIDKRTPGQIRLVSPDTNTHELEEQALELDDNSIEDADNNDQLSFELEYQLRDFIASNLSTIGLPDIELKLYGDSSFKEGVEYSTQVGSIDILAQDRNGNFYVFELKRARASDQAIGQVLRYMGWIKENLSEGKEVHGVIVAKHISERMRYAASMTESIHLFEYNINFSLSNSIL